MPIVSSPDAPSAWRAWCYLVRLSFLRQARAHLMVWISLGLLGLSLIVISIQTQTGRWSMARWSYPPGKGVTYGQHVENINLAGSLLWGEPEASLQAMVYGGHYAALYEATAFYRFSDAIVFSLFTLFLLPIWCVCFATEGLGREREAQNLLWVLTRPLSRPAIFLGKYVALVPWCLAFNLGGFTLLCLAGGRYGWLALERYWPAVLFGSLAFSALFHAFAAIWRRAAILALLYAFFLETIMSVLPGNFKRFSISFYTRSIMYERAHDLGIHPERPLLYLPVSGATAYLVLAGVTVLCLAIGAIVFTRNEYLDVN